MTRHHPSQSPAAPVPEETDRPASQYRTRRQDRRPSRHHRRPDVRERLERRHERARVQGL